MIYLVGLLFTALVSAVITASACVDDNPPLSNRRVREIERRDARREEELYG